MRKTVIGGERPAVSRMSSADVLPVSTPVWIEVDLGAVRHNLQEIRKFVGPRLQVMGVVKANAYGHGLTPVAQALVEGGVDFLGVASVREGVILREHGLNSRILVLGQILPEEAPLVVQHRLIQSVGDRPVAMALSEAAVRFQKPAAAHLKVDTGMGRYGVWYEEAPSLARQMRDLPGLKCEGIFTHFASAGIDLQKTEEQLARFSRTVERLREERLPVGILHTANSVGMIKFPAARQGLVRTGLLLYGCSPVKDRRLSMRLQAALTLKSRIRFIKKIPSGETVSYGGTYRLARPTKVATIPVGYAHGYVRALSSRSDVLVRGRRARVIGRITMEDLMADVTDVPDVQVADEVILIGRQGEEIVTAQELATHARTIPYEILAGFSPGIPRRYAG